MFSGIIETTSRIAQVIEGSEVLRIIVERPRGFDDLKTGDSVCTDGVCLTVEELHPGGIQFALGPETLKITGWTPRKVLNRVVNLERSLKLNDRIHGHLVTGHVDGRAQVLEIKPGAQSFGLTLELPRDLRDYVWSKGSVAVNGVSLTVNAVDEMGFEVGLIPETLKRTNLGELKPGDGVNLEVDNMARGLIHKERVQSWN